MRGEGFGIVDAIVCVIVVLAIAAFVWVMDKLQQGWSEMLGAPGPPPGIPCGCRACRARPSEPCSDFDE